MTDSSLRTVLLVVAISQLILGAVMFLAPGTFYDSLGKFPPENHHYIKDVASFYIALGIVFFIAARRRSWRVPVLAFATIQYAIHALTHLVDVNEAASELTGWFDFFALALVAVLFAALTTVAWRVRPEEPVQEEAPVE